MNQHASTIRLLSQHIVRLSERPAIGSQLRCIAGSLSDVADHMDEENAAAAGERREAWEESHRGTRSTGVRHWPARIAAWMRAPHPFTNTDNLFVWSLWVILTLTLLGGHH